MMNPTLNPAHSPKVTSGSVAKARRLSRSVLHAPNSTALRRFVLKDMFAVTAGRLATAVGLGVPLWLCFGNGVAFTEFFALHSVLASIATALYGWELWTLYPSMVDADRSTVPMRPLHDRHITVDVRNARNVNRPAVLRGAFTAFVSWMSPLLVLFGAMTLANTRTSNYGLQFGVLVCNVIEGIAFLYHLFDWIHRRCMRPRGVMSATGKALTSDGGTDHTVFRVLQLNVNSCVGADGKFDVQRVAAFITKSGAHVVALQDVERCTRIARNGHVQSMHRTQVDSMTELAEATGMTAVFCAKTATFGGQFGNCVLTRLPVLSDARLHFAGWKTRSSFLEGGPMPQAAVAVRIRPTGFRHDVWVVSSSFGGDSGGGEQLVEMGELVGFCRALPMDDEPEKHADLSSPHAVSSLSEARIDVGEAAGLLGGKTQVLPGNLIMCGDFQSPDAAPAIRFAELVGVVDVSALRGCAPSGSIGCSKTTFPASHPTSNFDRVMVRAIRSTVAPVRVSVLNETISTHRPVVVDFAEALLAAEPV